MGHRLIDIKKMILPDPSPDQAMMVEFRRLLTTYMLPKSLEALKLCGDRPRFYYDGRVATQVRHLADTFAEIESLMRNAGLK